MSMVIHAAVMYGFLVVLMRVAGRRTLGEMSAFDLVLMLVVGEATQQALLEEDHSVTGAWTVIATLIGLDLLMAWVKLRWPRMGHVLDGMPSVLVREGVVDREVMRRSRVSESDILRSARQSRGLERMAQVRHAVLEEDGSISVIAQAGQGTADGPARGGRPSHG
jgi:uncharacterized membrane protein YcaP (DUF421 family)